MHYLLCGEFPKCLVKRFVRLLLVQKAEFATVVSSSALSSTSLSENKTEEKKEKTAKSFTRWESNALRRLAYEYVREKREYSATANKKAARTLLIRHAINDDFSSLISFALQFVEETDRKNFTHYKGDDEFFGMLILLASHGMKNFSRDAASADSVEAVSLFYSLATLLEKIPVVGNHTRAACLLLLERMEKWTDLRSIDEQSSDIDRTFGEVQRGLAEKIGNKWPKENRLLFSTEDQELIFHRARDLFGENVAENRPSFGNWGYDRRLKLVSKLCHPVKEEDYLGSPFSCLGITKENYVKNFLEQDLVESGHCLRVRNMFRTSKKIPAEELILEWGWKTEIEKVLVNHIKQLRQFPLKGYVNVMDVSECVSKVIASLLAICCQGQNFVAWSIFENALAAPVLEALNERFAQKVAGDRKQVIKEVFSEYVRYFVDPNLPRCYTQREWWMTCCCSAHVDPELMKPFSDFNVEMFHQIGSLLASVVLEACKFPKVVTRGSVVIRSFANAFKISEVPLQEESVLLEEGRLNLVKMLKLNDFMMDIFADHQFEWLLFMSDNLPMKIPPRPWIDSGNGGPSYNKSTEVLRNLPEYPRVFINKEFKKRLVNRYQARPVFDALNDLGATPWQINRNMLKVVEKVFEMTNDASKEEFLKKLAVPLQSNTVEVPDYVETFGESVKVTEIPKEEWIKYSKKKHERMKKRNELNSLWYWMMYRLVLAEHFQHDVLFFPHNMDFRGRVYPISPYLSHMGDDINRCLLRFAQGKALGKRGFRWLKLHCINLTGHMKKKSIADRVEYSEKMIPEMLDSANSPLEGRRWWMESDEPWQTLATCMEIRDAIESGDPETFVSYLPIHQDGSCNGLQHYAALGRDRQGGCEVNLLPSELPADVYSDVAQRVEQKRIEDEASSNEEVRNLALALRSALPDPVPRKVIKQTVMTTVYGVTMYGALHQINRQLKAIDINPEVSARFASYLAHKTFSSLHDAFTSSMQLKDWFRHCAQSIVYLMRPVEWITPLGLPVVQPYLKLQEKQGKLCFLPVKVKQVNAFPPNFVHSLDSTHMMLTALHCRRAGITFAAVHDCYWTHACTVDQMNEICREQFIRLHKEPLVDHVAKFFREKYLPQQRYLGMPDKDLSHLEKVFTPNFKFGELNIEDVRKSIYFFS